MRKEKNELYVCLATFAFFAVLASACAVSIFFIGNLNPYNGWLANLEEGLLSLALLVWFYFASKKTLLSFNFLQRLYRCKKLKQLVQEKNSSVERIKHLFRLLYPMSLKGELPLESLRVLAQKGWSCAAASLYAERLRYWGAAPVGEILQLGLSHRALHPIILQLQMMGCGEDAQKLLLRSRLREVAATSDTGEEVVAKLFLEAHPSAQSTGREQDLFFLECVGRKELAKRIRRPQVVRERYSARAS